MPRPIHSNEEDNYCLLYTSEAILTSERSFVKEMEPMSRHTTFRIGGPAALYAAPGNEMCIRDRRRETGYKLHLTEMWDEFNEFVMLLSYFHVQIGKTVILY